MGARPTEHSLRGTRGTDEELPGRRGRCEAALARPAGGSTCRRTRNGATSEDNGGVDALGARPVGTGCCGTATPVLLSCRRGALSARSEPRCQIPGPMRGRVSRRRLTTWPRRDHQGRSVRLVLPRSLLRKNRIGDVGRRTPQARSEGATAQVRGRRPGPDGRHLSTAPPRPEDAGSPPRREPARPVRWLWPASSPRPRPPPRRTCSC